MADWKRWPHLEISVNLSPVQFRHVDLEATLRRLVAEHGVDPSRFVLEITEGVLLEATEHTNSILDALRSIGFKTALDDFGTGYSSLAYLCNFKFDKIKIDRSFVGRIASVDISQDHRPIGRVDRARSRHGYRRRGRRDRVRGDDDGEVGLHRIAGLLLLAGRPMLTRW